MTLVTLSPEPDEGVKRASQFDPRREIVITRARVLAYTRGTLFAPHLTAWGMRADSGAESKFAEGI